MSDQILELPVYLFLLIDTKGKTTPMVLREITVHIMILQLNILPVTCPIFFLFEREKQKAFNTEYCYPLT